jgi:hypothetical protein|tara:strand:- start:763 stop:933 length:171 start_codon:yes stop_codon:yes gene_type:complete
MPKHNIYKVMVKKPLPNFNVVPQIRPALILEKNKQVKAQDVFGKGVKNTKLKKKLI